MLKNFTILRKVLVITCVFIAFGCDNNFQIDPNDGGNPSLTDPDNTVVTNVGPVREIVVTDAFDKSDEIVGNLNDYISEFGQDLGGIGGEALRKSFVLEDQSKTREFDISETITCATSGTKSIVGNITVVLNQVTASGTLSGSWVTQYSNCVDVVLLSSADGNCLAEASIDGEIDATIDMSFTLRTFDASQFNNYSTDVSLTTSSIPLDVAVGSTASTQNYTFNYVNNSLSEDDELAGTISFQNDLYDINDIVTAREASDSSVVCPSAP